MILVRHCAPAAFASAHRRMTTRGLGEPEMVQVADWIVRALRSPAERDVLLRIHAEVRRSARSFRCRGSD